MGMGSEKQGNIVTWEWTMSCLLAVKKPVKSPLALNAVQDSTVTLHVLSQFVVMVGETLLKIVMMVTLHLGMVVPTVGLILASFVLSCITSLQNVIQSHPHHLQHHPVLHFLLWFHRRVL